MGLSSARDNEPAWALPQCFTTTLHMLEQRPKFALKSMSRNSLIPRWPHRKIYQTQSPTHMCSCDFIKGQKAGVLPRIGTLDIVAIVAQGTNWAVAVTHVFFENGRRRNLDTSSLRPVHMHLKL